jgi:hypothetical protein
MHSTPAKAPPSYVDDIRNIRYNPRPATTTPTQNASSALLRAPDQPSNWVLGMDLATTDIMRARQFGLPSLVNIRKAFGLTPLHTFSEITSDPVRRQHLRDLYGTIDKIEVCLWLPDSFALRSLICSRCVRRALWVF